MTKINAILSGRRGQILGFDTREGWQGWDMVRAMMPESEIGDLIIEVRSATAGASRQKLRPTSSTYMAIELHRSRRAGPDRGGKARRRVAAGQ